MSVVVFKIFDVVVTLERIKKEKYALLGSFGCYNDSIKEKSLLPSISPLCLSILFVYFLFPVCSAAIFDL